MSPSAGRPTVGQSYYLGENYEDVVHECVIFAFFATMISRHLRSSLAIAH